MMKETVNGRGFPTVKFSDFYSKECHLQISSLADERCIWLGLDEATPKILASVAIKNGIETDQTTGWIPFPIPPEVLMSTAMHLSQDQVKELLPFLIKFAETGKIN